MRPLKIPAGTECMNSLLKYVYVTPSSFLQISASSRPAGGTVACEMVPCPMAAGMERTKLSRMAFTFEIRTVVIKLVSIINATRNGANDPKVAYAEGESTAFRIHVSC